MVFVVVGESSASEPESVLKTIPFFTNNEDTLGW
jgi:hypothetical protein